MIRLASQLHSNTQEPTSAMQLPRTIIAFLLASVAYIVYALLSRFLRSRRHAKIARELGCEDPPLQPNKYPFGIDHIIQVLAADSDKLLPYDAIQRTVNNNSITFAYSVLGWKNITTADEEILKAILATQFKDFELGPNRVGNFWPLLGNGIFTQDGAEWEHSRAMMRPQFARDQLSGLQLEYHSQNMMNALDIVAFPNAHGWTQLVDLQVLFFRLTLDVATGFLFGQSVESQRHLMSDYQSSPRDPKDPLRLDFATAFDHAQSYLARRTRFLNFYWLCNPKEFRESCKVCHDFIDHFVKLALSKEKRETKPGEDKRDEKKPYVFLDALVAETRDPIELRSQLLHILLAGRDTTASLLSWLFMCLAKDPVRYKKLRDTVIQDFGTYENPSGLTFSRLKGCQYLQYCNSETLRLFPSVPFNFRVASKDTTLPRGGGKDGKSKVFIPKGTIVDYSVHVMHHRKDIWGEDAEDFNPERWEGRKVGWEFLPFNGGPRICVGQQFALTEASYVTVRLLQRYDKMEYEDTDPIIRHNITLTNCNAHGVKIRAHVA